VMVVMVVVVVCMGGGPDTALTFCFPETRLLDNALDKRRSIVARRVVRPRSTRLSRGDDGCAKRRPVNRRQGGPVSFARQSEDSTMLFRRSSAHRGRGRSRAY
jgi:hypothetical protein